MGLYDFIAESLHYLAKLLSTTTDIAELALKQWQREKGTPGKSVAGVYQDNVAQKNPLFFFLFLLRAYQ